ncbi:MAG: hypothetical protein R8P61_17270 [Bacteroidia bacterium]|nr:hypothetical protein [Bacteroidia bacterium]
MTESFETEGDGSRYEANYFADFCGNTDWYRRMVASECTAGSENDFIAFSITGIDGSYFMAADDAEESPENPLGSGEAAYVTLATLDVSSYDEITVSVKVAANTVTNFENDHAIEDAFLAQYAFDGNIATGANSAGALPSEANLNTGSYTNAIAFYASSASSLLSEDTDLNGTPDGSDLGATLTTYSSTFNTGGASNLSVRFVIRTDQGGEDIAFDDIEVIGDVTLPVVLADFSAKAEADNISLSWETFSEINSKGMMLESSFQSGQWEDLIWIPAKGINNEGADYQITLERMPPGEYQFRLRMEDWDGSKEWSSTLSLIVSEEDRWKVYSSTDFIHIDQGSFEDSFTFQLYDQTGKLIKNLNLQGAKNEFPRDESLPSNLYYFIIRNNRGRYFSARIFIP